MNSDTLDIPRMEPTPVNTRACAECIFSTMELFPGHVQRVMVCRESPPQIIAMAAPGGMSTQTMFPVVHPQNWCFRFQPKVITGA